VCRGAIAVVAEHRVSDPLLIVRQGNVQSLETDRQILDTLRAGCSIRAKFHILSGADMVAIAAVRCR
jgi:hypothetical protein